MATPKELGGSLEGKLSKKEIPSKAEWRELSFQIGRTMVGGAWNSQNPNIFNYGVSNWLNLMTNKRQIRKEGVKYLREGIMSVALERKGTPREYHEDGQVMALHNVADYLETVIMPKIGKRGKRGNETMVILNTLATSLFYCDKTTGSIRKIIRPFAQTNLQR